MGVSEMRIDVACGVAMLSSVGMASAQDLSGFYAGGSMATHSGSQVYDGDVDDPYDLEGPAFGLFAGYLMSRGNLSFGGELSVSKGGVYEYYAPDDESYKDEYEYTRFIDLKGRLGYTMSNVLLYGTVGLSRSNFISDVVDSVNVSGNLYGVGAEYKVNEKFFVGAEYLRRNYEFNDPFQSVDIDAEMNSLNLRAGISF
jgi:outer membrane immunogenic protein